jgi:hypothetical protein
MTRFNRWTLFSAVVVASTWSVGARPAAAQEASSKATATVKSDGKADANAKDAKSAIIDSVSVQDVEKAAQQLAIAVQEAVRKATEDPAVKVAALKVAKNAVTAAQVVVTQQAQTLQTVLDALAKEIAQATVKQQTKSGNH